MAVLGQDARAIYDNQDALKRQLAEAAGVRSDQVYFFNQTANNDARTGVTTMSVSQRLRLLLRLRSMHRGGRRVHLGIIQTMRTG